MRDVNVEGAERIANACREAGVKRLIHVSSLLAGKEAPSEHQRSKAEGEQAVQAALKEAITVRPSAMFGYEDRLLNVIGLFSAVPLGYPVVNHGAAVRHPLYVGDFAEALLRLAKAKPGQFEGKKFDLLGPHPYTQRELINWFIKQTLREHPIINMPPWMVFAYSRMFPEWRRPPFTMDTVRELLADEKRTSRHLGFADLGISQLESIETGALTVIRGFRPVYAYASPQAK